MAKRPLKFLVLSFCMTLVVVSVVASLATGCSASLKDMLLDGTKDPPLPPQKKRADLLKELGAIKGEIEGVKTEEAARLAAEKARASQGALPIEKAKTWGEARKILPRTASGKADWVKALETGIVAPRSSPDPNTPASPVLELDIELLSNPDQLFTATFPHAAHTKWLGCGSCHSAIFPLKKSPEPRKITMGKIREGMYCGACHGKVAFAVEGECQRCHLKVKKSEKWVRKLENRTELEKVTSFVQAVALLPKADSGAPDWARAIKEGDVKPRPSADLLEEEEMPISTYDVEMIPQDTPLFKVVFPHEAHTRWLSCTNCHPDIFIMEKGANPITMEKIIGGEYCGRCHGKVAFGVRNECSRCHPNLRPDAT